MRDDYIIKGKTESFTVTIEKEVVDTVKKMAQYTKLSESEIVNTAIKRFITVHKDFQPPVQGKPNIVT